MTFWAIELTPGMSFQTVPPFDLHVTQATLPASAKDEGRNVIQVTLEDKSFALGSVKLGTSENLHLDLFFEEGTSVTFAVLGKNPVHLTGYFVTESDDLDDGEEFDLDEDDDEELMGADDLSDDDLDLDDEEEDAFPGQKRKLMLGANGVHAAKKGKVEAAVAKPQTPNQNKAQTPKPQENKGQAQTPKQPQQQQQNKQQTPKPQQQQTPKAPQENKPQTPKPQENKGQQKQQTPKPQQQQENKAQTPKPQLTPKQAPQASPASEASPDVSSSGKKKKNRKKNKKAQNDGAQ